MTNLISRTGRVQSWIDDPTGRLPVSCTVLEVADSMTGPNGIEASWRFASHALRFGAGCAIHLSKLSPKGVERPSGVMPSGPVSFGKIYSSLNEVIGRGNRFKNGALCLHLDLSHPDAIDFITTNRSELPWVKRCINITEEWWQDCTFKEELLHGIKSGDIWLNKVKYDNEGNESEVMYAWRFTCPHEAPVACNMSILGACEFDDIPRALLKVCQNCASLHGRTGVGDSGEYLPSETDRQVGLGMLGLANLLRRYGVTYEQFGEALAAI
jgi:hypothetical protein